MTEAEIRRQAREESAARVAAGGPAVDMSQPPPRVTLCAPCWASWNAWLDAPMAPPPIRLDGTGIRTVRDVAAAQERRANDHYALVRHQQKLIRWICAIKHEGDDQDG